ncbi:MAG: pentapeptide repeat-containing protein, partial [Proteobacteria bacterium]|nr:pentapeptide repeat-containing protein [Pseudomonadota bacterium]
MTDPTGTSGDPGPDQAEPEEAESVELRQVSEDELKEILEAHEKWLGSNEKEGQRADLFRANLQGADLLSANLQGANLGGANLQEAELSCSPTSRGPNFIWPT